MTEKNKNKKNKTAEIDDSILENATGGFGHYNPSWLREYRFRFDEDEVDLISDKLKIDLVPGKVYWRSELNDLGIEGSNGTNVIKNLQKIGLKKNSEETKMEHS